MPPRGEDFTEEQLPGGVTGRPRRSMMILSSFPSLTSSWSLGSGSTHDKKGDEYHEYKEKPQLSRDEVGDFRAVGSPRHHSRKNKLEEQLMSAENALHGSAMALVHYLKTSGLSIAR